MRWDLLLQCVSSLIMRVAQETPTGSSAVLPKHRLQLHHTRLNQNFVQADNSTAPSSSPSDVLVRRASRHGSDFLALHSAPRRVSLLWGALVADLLHDSGQEVAVVVNGVAFLASAISADNTAFRPAMNDSGRGDEVVLL